MATFRQRSRGVWEVRVYAHARSQRDVDLATSLREALRF
jgi:hypothetical protein